MAKIRIEQIKDLSLTNGVITIGTGNTITPLTSVDPATQANSIVTGLSVSGNKLVPTYVTKATFLTDYSTTAQMNSAIGTAIGNLDSTATIATIANDVVTLKAGLTQTDGIVANNASADITLAKVAKTGAAADISIADAGSLITATTVEGALAEIAAEIDNLQAIDPVVTTVTAGNGIAVADNGTANDHAYTISADLTLGYDSTTKKITLTGANGGEYGEIDATDFIKDGMLTNATFDEATNKLTLTWNTDANITTTEIDLTDLVDVYTAGNDGVVVSGYSISHKTGSVAANTSKGSVTTNDGTTISVNVPTVKVDAYGHVIELTETAASLTLPSSIGTAVQTVNGDDYVSAVKTGTTVALTTNVADGIANAAADTDGLATAYDVKTYVDNQISTNNTATAVQQFVQTSESTTVTLTHAPLGVVTVAQNGLTLATDEYSVAGTTLTINPDVAHVAGDVYTVSYLALAN